MVLDNLEDRDHCTCMKLRRQGDYVPYRPKNAKKSDRCRLKMVSLAYEGQLDLQGDILAKLVSSPLLIQSYFVVQSFVEDCWFSAREGNRIVIQNRA